MIQIEVPGRGELTLGDLVLDVNGTIARDGLLIEGVATRLLRLSEHLEIHMLTADTHGRQAELDRALGLCARRLVAGQPEDAQKESLVRTLGPERVVALGNGANDATMLRAAAVGIAVLGPEGLSVAALKDADVVVSSILDGLELLLCPRRLVATLRR
jgi:P-type E1-E2 ATPase